MTLEQIKQAVREGKTVHWSNTRYTVSLHIGNKTGQETWLINCYNGSCIGLTWLDGVTMNGSPEEFFIVPVDTA